MFHWRGKNCTRASVTETGLTIADDEFSHLPSQFQLLFCERHGCTDLSSFSAPPPTEDVVPECLCPLCPRDSPFARRCAALRCTLHTASGPPASRSRPVGPTSYLTRKVVGGGEIRQGKIQGDDNVNNHSK